MKDLRMTQFSEIPLMEIMSFSILLITSLGDTYNFVTFAKTLLYSLTCDKES
jgi:hypothetical protein